MSPRCLRHNCHVSAGEEVVGPKDGHLDLGSRWIHGDHGGFGDDSRREVPSDLMAFLMGFDGIVDGILYGILWDF